MRSRLRLRDLSAEAVAGILRRPGRSALTMLGTVLGVGAFVAILGLTACATGQISQRFTALMATEVVVEQLPSLQEVTPAFPPDADGRVQALNGVRNAGTYWTIDAAQSGLVSGVLLPGQVGSRIPVLAASPGYLRAIEPTVQQGRLFDEYHQENAERVAVLGGAIAARIGINQVKYRPAIFIGGVPITVIGIINDARRQPETLLSVIVPTSTAAAIWGPSKQPAKMLIETELGAAQLVGAQAALALRPEAPDRFTVRTPPDPRSLRDGINTDLASLFLILAGVCLTIGAAGIANATLVAVMERASEIGLRRALGACRRHIAGQFLAESALLGGLGGLLGAGLGTAAVVATAISKQWTPIMATWTVVSAPVVGLLVGVLAGLYPALRAAAVEPVAALRR